MQSKLNTEQLLFICLLLDRRRGQCWMFGCLLQYLLVLWVAEGDVVKQWYSLCYQETLQLALPGCTAALQFLQGRPVPPRQHKSMIAIINPGKIEVELWSSGAVELWRTGEEENRLYLVQPSLAQLCTPDTLILIPTPFTSHYQPPPPPAWMA